MTKGVQKTTGQKLAELAPFFIGETRVSDIAFWIFQIDELVGHIHVTAHNHRLFFLQGDKIGAERVLKFHTELDARKLPLRIGGIHSNQIKIREFRGDDPALPVKGFVPDPKGHRLRLFSGKESRTGVSLLDYGRIPVFVIAGKFEIRLFLLHLRLLQADHIRSFRLQKFGEPLSHTGPQAIYIPGHQLHGNRLQTYE